jgi:hypothetical protein
VAIAPPPAASGAPGPTACPKCGASVSPGSRFCNACGSSLYVAGGSSTGTLAPGGAPPLDIRNRVEEDRGPLKRLQMLVPGFRGYREGEDIREADSMLRREIADKVKNIRVSVENARSALANAGQFTSINDLAPLIADLLRIEGEIRHAEQGYTGLSPAIRIKPQQIDRLYEYDYGFAQAADQLGASVSTLPAVATTAGNPSAIATLVATIRGQLAQLDQAFKVRVQMIEGIRVS